MCALFGRQRDISLFLSINRELLGNVITQECAFYQYRTDQSTINIYGESAEDKYYDGPILFNCLIDRENQAFVPDDMNLPDFEWNITFKFLRQDLVDQDVVPDVGDIILYYGGYYEIDSTNANQFIVGKNPAFPYNENPLNPGLEQFGSNYSIICSTHYVPGDKPGITRERL